MAPRSASTPYSSTATRASHARQYRFAATRATAASSASLISSSFDPLNSQSSRERPIPPPGKHGLQALALSAFEPVWFDADFRGVTRIELSTRHYWQFVTDDLTFAFR